VTTVDYQRVGWEDSGIQADGTCWHVNPRRREHPDGLYLVYLGTGTGMAAAGASGDISPPAALPHQTKGTDIDTDTDVGRSGIFRLAR
jgi:hypothetical protein